MTAGPAGSPASNMINSVDVSFIDVGEQTAKRLDLNTRLLWPIDRWGVDIAWATATTKQLEQEVQIFGPEDRDDNLGEIGTPEYKFTSTLSFVKNDWEVLLQNRFYGDGQQDDSDAPRPNPFLAGDWGTQPNSRDVDWVDSVWYTDLSVTYFTDRWSASVGINKLFDEDPPLIDTREGPNRNNAVSSSGYHFFGRTWFATLSMAF